MLCVCLGVGITISDMVMSLNKLLENIQILSF